MNLLVMSLAGLQAAQSTGVLFPESPSVSNGWQLAQATWEVQNGHPEPTIKLTIVPPEGMELDSGYDNRPWAYLLADGRPVPLGTFGTSTRNDEKVVTFSDEAVLLDRYATSDLVLMRGNKELAKWTLKGFPTYSERGSLPAPESLPWGLKLAPLAQRYSGTSGLWSPPGSWSASLQVAENPEGLVHQIKVTNVSTALTSRSFPPSSRPSQSINLTASEASQSPWVRVGFLVERCKVETASLAVEGLQVQEIDGHVYLLNAKADSVKLGDGRVIQVPPFRTIVTDLGEGQNRRVFLTLPIVGDLKEDPGLGYPLRGFSSSMASNMPAMWTTKEGSTMIQLASRGEAYGQLTRKSSPTTWPFELEVQLPGQWVSKAGFKLDLNVSRQKLIDTKTGSATLEVGPYPWPTWMYEKHPGLKSTHGSEHKGPASLSFG